MQSKVSQKEKNKYRILVHIYGIQKNGTDETSRDGFVDAAWEGAAAAAAKSLQSVRRALTSAMAGALNYE